MSDSEVGLYMRLLCAQWSRGCLPDNDSDLIRFSRGSTTVHTDLIRVKEKFKKGDDGKLRNARLEVERGKQNDFSEAQRQKGIKSAQSRKPRFNPGSTPVQPRPGCNPVEPSVSVSASSLNKERGKILRLHGIPSSPDEVVAYGATLEPKIGKEICHRFFRHYESQAKTNPDGQLFWVTTSGTVITKWTFKLEDFSKEPHPNGKAASKSSNGPRQRWQIDNEMTSLRTRINALREEKEVDRIGGITLPTNKLKPGVADKIKSLKTELSTLQEEFDHAL